MTPIYRASTKIVFEEKESGITEIGIPALNLTATLVQNIIEEIQSWSLVNEVVISLPDSILEAFHIPKNLSSTNNRITDLTRFVQRNLTAIAIPKSDVIKINVLNHDPVISTMIANMTTEVLINRNLDARRSQVGDVKNTVEEQLKYFEQKVMESEEALKNYKETSKVIYLDRESAEIFERVTASEVEFNRTTTELDASMKRLDFVKTKLAKEREDLVPNITTITSPWAQELKRKLVDLQVQYTTLKVENYAEDHPMLVELKSQIEEAQYNLREETKKIAMGESTIDPLSQIERYLEEIAELEVMIYTSQAQQSALRRILNEYDEVLKSLPEKELELGRLQRDKTVADNIYTMLLRRREEIKIEEAEKISNIRVIDRARIPAYPIRPRKKLYIILGIFFGCIFGITLSLLFEFFDLRIKDSDDIEKNLNWPVLGMIPKHMNGNTGPFSKCLHLFKKERHTNILDDLISIYNSPSPVAEAFRMLRTNILSQQQSKSHIKTILFTSSYPQEGKSFIAANTAITMAELGQKTLLIDTDLRKSVLHAHFNKNIKPGLSEILGTITEIRNKHNMKIKYSDNDIAEEFKDSVSDIISMIHLTTIDNLYLITSGSTPQNPSELLASKQMKDLTHLLKNHFDIIIFDLPPVLPVADALILATDMDMILFTIEKSRCRPDEITKAKYLIEMASQDSLIGTILNKVEIREGYYSSYYTHYAHTEYKNSLGD